MSRKPIVIDIENLDSMQRLPHKAAYHVFRQAEIEQFRPCLLSWYRANRRELPWRSKTTTAYATWVSEVMLQQTRVQTVITYFNKWMQRFPTVAELAAASDEDVNQHWAGLGYYSRARQLHAGAKLVVDKYNGVVPSGINDLLTIPGIGRYTAGAISSIAFGNVEPIVDGNVMRVFSRLRACAAPPNNTQASSLFWRLAKDTVDPESPGDFNQALMELGARVCTRTKAKCDECPVQVFCHAYNEVKRGRRPAPRLLLEDVDGDDDGEECTMCDPAQSAPDMVTRYPQAKKKKARKESTLAVCVIMKRVSVVDTDACEYLLIQRPAEGLLASQWEFPNTNVSPDHTYDERKLAVDEAILRRVAIANEVVARRFEVSTKPLIHDFTHRRHRMMVEAIEIPADAEFDAPSDAYKWFTIDQMNQVGVTTGVKKVLKSVNAAMNIEQL